MPVLRDLRLTLRSLRTEPKYTSAVILTLAPRPVRIIIMVVAVASYLPARRAAEIDPLVLLKRGG